MSAACHNSTRHRLGSRRAQSVGSPVGQLGCEATIHFGLFPGERPSPAGAERRGAGRAAALTGALGRSPTYSLAAGARLVVSDVESLVVGRRRGRTCGWLRLATKCATSG